jgi:hypothetical protein
VWVGARARVCVHMHVCVLGVVWYFCHFPLWTLVCSSRALVELILG